MNYEELTEKIAIRTRRLGMMAATGNWPMPGKLSDSATNLAWYEDKGYLADDPILRGALGRVATFTRNVRTIRDSRMTGAEKQAAIADQTAELIKAVEQAKTKAINQTMQTIDDRMQKFRNRQESGDAARQLLEYRRAELKYSTLDPDAALGRLDIMQRDGYSIAELETVGAKSPEAQAKAAEVRRALPPGLADRDGIAMLERLATLTNLPTGTINYTIQSDGAEVTQSTHIVDLVDDSTTRQTIKDLNLAPVAAPEPEGVSA